MKSFYEIVLDSTGKPVSGATVTVNIHGGGAATLYSDDGITPTANPVTTDSLGRYHFYVADGRYDLIAASSTVSYTQSDVEISDVTEANSGDSIWNVKSGGFKIDGSSSGSVTLAVPAAAGSTSLTLGVTGNGTAVPTFPAATDTVVELTQTQVLTNKTLTAPTITGATLTTSTLTSPAINGTPTGTGIPTITLKKGSGAGSYTTASTSYVDVDGTNLAYTVTIPTGWKLTVSASGIGFQNTAVANIFISLFDGSTLLEQTLTPSATVTGMPFSLNWVITGDGASHTVKLQYKTQTGADTAGVTNTSATSLPTMVFILSPSN